MSEPAYHALIALCALAALAAGAMAGIYARGKDDRYEAMATQPVDTQAAMPALASVERRDCTATRRVRAGAVLCPGPEPMAVLAPLPPEKSNAVTRMARAIATVDFRQFHRPSANPYSKHSRAHAVWAIEYAATWQELAESEPKP